MRALPPRIKITVPDAIPAQIPPPRVLVVEDEPLIALGFKLVLEGMGLEVPAVVDTRAAAIECARNLNVDMILMDVGLKGGDDGIATAQEILRQQNVAILFVTGSAAEVAERGMGQFHVLSKPFAPAALERTVRAILRLR